MNMLELLKKFRTNKKKHPNWREGQCWFNSLHELNDAWADEIRGNNSIDPFYKNENVTAFLLWVAKEEKEK